MVASVPRRYADIGKDIGVLVERKQKAYGDSFGKSAEILRVMYPNGIPVSKLRNALAVTRVVDKLFRIATDEDAFGESPWQDIAGYALLALRSDVEQKRKRRVSRTAR
jgi:hypothetical protein